MNEILNSIKQNPSQNFNNNSSILKNPKKFSKTPKPRSKCMKKKKKKKKNHIPSDLKQGKAENHMG